MTPDITGTPNAPIRRSDYAPPLWRVQRITLDVDLDPARTHVKASLSVERSGDHLEPLCLNGDGLLPLEVTIDGYAADCWTMDGDDLLIPLEGKTHIITTEVRIAPRENQQLMGLYLTGETLCTQCEAQGFRRITFFPDRPDVLTEYRVRMSADEVRFPVLLSNGNRVDGGQEPDGRHWAEWHDPFPKPSYLFAMVAGDLAANRSTFTTRSGRTVALTAWANAADIDRTQHAMASLKAAMAWDEENYGREYDLDEFNLVAVDDFNFGAMENKGLNIFNSRFILADSETATDSDYDQIAAAVAHEYFHNWSGNRVTCRDWFNLGLKEGLTVYRDQSFSGDQGSHMLKRIEDVGLLQAHQFPEDAGPLAHPVRPESYTGIASLYTATIYRKGAELVRMLAVLLGPARFREACELYFDRHDGEAATIDDFLACMEEASGIDLSRFAPWYEEAGTPRIDCALTHDERARRATITLRQLLPTVESRPRLIPLRLRLLDPRSGLPASEERLIQLTAQQESFEFDDIGGPPLVSINRGFTAPVIIEHSRDADELALIARVEDDPFLRHQALQQLMLRSLLERASGHPAGARDIVGAVATTLADASLDPAFIAEAIRLPDEKVVAGALDRVDPEAVWRARQEMAKTIGKELELVWREMRRVGGNTPYSREPKAKGRRRLNNVALAYLTASGAADADELAYRQFVQANNMTDREAALTLLADSYSPLRDRALEIFLTRFAERSLVVDKWFAIQAGAARSDTAAQVERLSLRADFTLANPNRARSLIENFGQNQRAFHSADGKGYRWLARQTIAFDALNPRTAAKFLAPLAGWKKIEPRRAALMRTELQAIAGMSGISKDLLDLAEKSLGAD